MFSFFKNFGNIGDLLPLSVKDAAGRVSSSRIQSYSLLLLIWVVMIVFLIMEIIRASKTGDWEISETIEQIFFALLAHHVTFAGVTKNSKSEPRGDIFKEEDEVAEKPKTVKPTSVPEKNKAQDTKTSKDPGKVGGKDIEELI